MKPPTDTALLGGATTAAQALEGRRRAFDLCVRKTRRNIKALADEPKSWSNAADGNYAAFNEGFYELGNWTTSFFTGMALLAWRATEEEHFLQQTLRLAPAYRRKAFTPEFHSHHDMGFLYSLYSVALYKLTGEAEHRAVGLAAALALARRYNERGRFIRAWGALGTDEHENMAIIDCLMNLPLLYWASEVSGDRTYRDIAVAHADTTLKTFIRPDDSVRHAYRFDLQTGAPLGPDNYCGFGVDSSWARGAAWGIYGFAMSHRYTGDPKYLDASLRLLRKFISQLDTELVPVWDFRLPASEKPLRDASAASVAVCAIQELEKLKAADAAISNLKHALLARLCSADYLNFDENCPGVQQLGQAGISRNAYTSWGDYYLMEALDRELHKGETWW
jgi:unsaturated chondroitin disaccharide hydrolase